MKQGARKALNTLQLLPIKTEDALQNHKLFSVLQENEREKENSILKWKQESTSCCSASHTRRQALISSTNWFVDPRTEGKKSSSVAPCQGSAVTAWAEKSTQDWADFSNVPLKSSDQTPVWQQNAQTHKWNGSV